MKTKNIGKLPAKKVVIKANVKTIGAHPSGAGKILIDKEVPKRFRKSIALHERVEDKLMSRGDKYMSAHREANKEEKKTEGAKKYKEEKRQVVDKIYRSRIAKRKK